MKLVIIPPYRGTNYTPTEGHITTREILASMEAKGQLEGVEVDIGDAYPTDYTADNRNEEVWANITVGFLKRVREYAEMGKYDAIIGQGSIEPGFFGGRMISKIPIAFALHSAVHVASLIGGRFSIIELTDAMASIVRHHVQNYGLDHKLASIRTLELSSNQVRQFIREHKKEDRAKAPEVKDFLDKTVAQCIAAIDKERVDTLILACPPLQCLEYEIRQQLDDAGYEEIPLVSELPAAVEMAKAMVNMKLKQAARAFPNEELQAKPEFR